MFEDECRIYQSDPSCRIYQVIRRNGGLLESEEFLPDRGETVQRYWLPANVAA